MSGQRRQFGQRPLVAGSILGVRMFHTENPDSPRLAGSVYSYEWLPGDNTARCIFVNMALAAMLRENEPAHELLELGCTCGFYAYFHAYLGECYRHKGLWNAGPSDDDARYKAIAEASGKAVDGIEPYHLPALLKDRDQTGTCDVAGIIEGYGRVVVGDKGFRAEKARILAIARPDVPLGVSSARSCLPSRRVRREGAFEALAANYPRAAVFSTVDAMLGEFPLTDPADLDAAVGS